ncbi:hypothetical protein LXL04_007723 [Taraxacum kok-saghyz]
MIECSPKIRNLLCPPPKKKPLAVAVPLKLASSNPSIDSRSPITRRLSSISFTASGRTTHDASSPLTDARFHRESPISQSISQSHSPFHMYLTTNMDHIDAINMSGDEGADEIGTKPTAVVQRKNLTRSDFSKFKQEFPVLYHYFQTESSDKHMEIAPSPSDSRKYMETMVKGHTNSQVLQVYDISESELANDWKYEIVLYKMLFGRLTADEALSVVEVWIPSENLS